MGKADTQSAEGPASGTTAAVAAKKGRGFRICSASVLLTYSGIKSLAHWRQFLTFVQDALKTWGVTRWCATMESSKAGNWHIHLMLQFQNEIDRACTFFSFQGIRPNAGPNNRTGEDLCGQGMGGRNPQKSINRGFFYVWADKKGTCRDEEGNVCVDGNYWPAWFESAAMTYAVFVDWPETLWKQYKLSHDVYDDLLPKCRHNYAAKKRNLDAIRQREEEDAVEAEIKETYAACCNGLAQVFHCRCAPIPTPRRPR